MKHRANPLKTFGSFLERGLFKQATTYGFVIMGILRKYTANSRLINVTSWQLVKTFHASMESQGLIQFFVLNQLYPVFTPTLYLSKTQQDSTIILQPIPRFR
jgi:hypothetical protein